MITFGINWRSTSHSEDEKIYKFFKDMFIPFLKKNDISYYAIPYINQAYGWSSVKLKYKKDLNYVLLVFGEYFIQAEDMKFVFNLDKLNQINTINIA